MRRTEIFYFTGTGNSLHVARELQRRIPGSELIPMVRHLKDTSIRPKARSIGLVFPIYLTSIPKPVRMFLEILDFTSVDHVFAVATGSTTFNIADIVIDRILKKKGKKLDQFEIVKMASNTPTGLKPGKGNMKWVEEISKEDLQRIDREITPEIDRIALDIGKRTDHKNVKMTYPLRLLSYSVMNPLTRNMKSEIGFYSDDSCIGCGSCEKVCPSGKIRIDGERPVWIEEVSCYFCFACFNFCPQQAILVKGKYDKKDGRFHHPDVSIEEIFHQK